MTVDAATLYSTGLPNIGDEYTFRDGAKCVVVNVQIAERHMSGQQDPTLVLQFFTRDGRRSDRSNNSMEDLQHWIREGTKKTKTGPYQVVQPYVYR